MTSEYWCIVNFLINTYVLTVSVCLARGADENLAGASEDHAGGGAGNGHVLLQLLVILLRNTV